MSTMSRLHALLGLTYRRWALSRRLDAPSEIARRAWRVISKQQYCLVVTEGPQGPAARVVEPLRPDPGGMITFGTDPSSRKVAQILRTGRCLLVYQDDRRRACVTLECDARFADPSAPVRFRGFWRAFWPAGPGRGFVNVTCMPTAMEVWDGTAVIAPDPFGRRSVRLERQSGEPWRLVDTEGTTVLG
ncbi:pyridoxamine 5'-phosphate oxidase family protein [Brachybacterium paraconglomeratum]|uniref:pyridoxamine 5'-phosphate oxidase family protein n=1 Tax=Brachybacterium paraconglomeratum TaxID=173362 RepID=UPI0031E7C989